MYISFEIIFLKITTFILFFKAMHSRALLVPMHIATGGVHLSVNSEPISKSELSLEATLVSGM